MKKTLVALALVVFQAASASAQESMAVPPGVGRRILDDVSTGMVAAQIIAAEVHQYRERGWRGAGCQALAVVAVNLEAMGIKALVRETRPNGANDESFLSQHSANLFAASSWKWGVSVPIAVGGAWARVGSAWHWWWDVVAGSALGAANRWLVGKIPGCGGLEP